MIDTSMDLETQQLQALLTHASCLPETLILKKTTASTNDDVKQLAQHANTSSILVCSESQTQGRGQHERSWISPKGNIYLSCLVNLKTPIDGRLALEVALNILQIDMFKNLSLQVKWPNDLYSSQGKWGGILIEPISMHSAVIGVGVNLFTPPDHQTVNASAPQHAQAITSLSDLGIAHLNRIEIIGQLYIAIQQAAQWFEHGCSNLAQRFNHHASFIHQDVTFEYTQGQIEGVFTGIDDSGAVTITHNNQQERFFQGRMRLASATALTSSDACKVDD